MRRARSWLGLVVVGVLLSACSSPNSLTGTADRASGQLLPLHQVRTLTEPGVALTRPADGRLRGDGFAAVVTGVASAHEAGGPGPVVVAPDGDHLVVFTVTLAPAPASPGAPSLSADVSMDGGVVDFDPSTLVATGHATYVVSVPDKTGDVNLELSAAGLTQAFSLTSLRRVGPVPTILYRGATGPTVSITLDQSEVIPVTVPANDFTGLETIAITSATLTDFEPGDPGVQPPGLDQAYLVITGMDAENPDPPPGYPSGSHFVGNFTALPGSDLTLTLPDGHTMAATHVGSTTAGMLDGTYYFTVPADLTSATVSIAPGSQIGVEYPVYTGDTATIDFPQPAIFTLGFPPPSAPVAPATTAPATPAGGERSLPVPARQEGTGTVLSGELAAGGLPCVAAFLFVVLWRRRRGKLWRGRRHAAGPPPFRPLRLIPAPPPAPALGSGPRFDGDASRSGDAPASLAPGGAAGATSGDASGPDASGDLGPQGPKPVAGRAAATIGPRSTPGVDVLVLGPIEVAGWRRRPRRRVVTALLCYLCMHPGRPVSGDQLLAALWPLGSERPEASRASLHTYVSELRRSLPDGVLPDAGTTEGYVLHGPVATDWATFTSLVTEAEGAGGARADVCLSQALSLVRGVPFKGATSELFEWATTEHHVAAMEISITACAHELATMRLASGDGHGAGEAALKGLVGVPDSAVLSTDLLRAAVVAGDPAGIRRAWQTATRALGKEEVVRLFDELGMQTPTHQRTS